MFFGYNFLGDKNALDAVPSTPHLSGVKISNGIFDWIDIKDELIVSAGVFDTEIPLEWADNTVMRCMFSNTINAGNISDIMSSLSKIEVQRKEASQTESEWITLQTIYKNQNQIQSIFTIYDTYNANNVLYEYAVVPYDDNGTMGARITSTVLSYFNNVYICDASKIYVLTNEHTISGAETVQKSAVYEPYGAEFPTTAYNATTKYRRANTSAVLLAPTTTNGRIDRVAQKNLINEFNDWLTNRRGKIYKDFNGNVRLITVYSAITSEYYGELGNGICKTSFDWHEIGKINQDYLKKNGMLERFL